MGATVLFGGAAEERAAWMQHLEAARRAQNADVTIVADPDDIAPETVDYLLYAPDGVIEDVSVYSNVKAVMSLWAGVERILERDDLPDAPIVRMVEPGLSEGMRDYVTGHVLRAHLNIDAQQAAQKERRWDPMLAPKLARDRRVGVLGLGALGIFCAEALRDLGFQIAGWSRRSKELPDVESFVGEEGLAPFLARSEILVCLVPFTPETENLLNADRLAQLPEGAHIINAARGQIIDDQALLAALDGPLGGAVLDVFSIEPLPSDHPFWDHPKILVTPHIASVTRAETASLRVMQQIVDAENGIALEHVVDKVTGY